MEVSLYSQKRIDEMSEVERLRVVTQLQKKIIENQEEIIRNLNSQLSAAGVIIEQLHKRLKENGLA
jgi:uncharacterized coiled-coil protein SlyX